MSGPCLWGVESCNGETRMDSDFGELNRSGDERQTQLMTTRGQCARFRGQGTDWTARVCSSCGQTVSGGRRGSPARTSLAGRAARFLPWCSTRACRRRAGARAVAGPADCPPHLSCPLASPATPSRGPRNTQPRATAGQSARCPDSRLVAPGPVVTTGVSATCDFTAHLQSTYQSSLLRLKDNEGRTPGWKVIIPLSSCGSKVWGALSATAPTPLCTACF